MERRQCRLFISPVYVASIFPSTLRVEAQYYGKYILSLFPLIHVDTLIHCTTDGNEPLREVCYTGYYLFCFLIK